MILIKEVLCINKHFPKHPQNSFIINFYVNSSAWQIKGIFIKNPPAPPPPPSTNTTTTHPPPPRHPFLSHYTDKCNFQYVNVK